MNIVGCILFVIAGIIVIKVSGVTKKQGLSDYSKCNTAIGKVTHTEDCCGDRWIVYFTDDSGRKLVGMDDIIAASSFQINTKDRFQEQMNGFIIIRGQTTVFIG